MYEENNPMAGVNTVCQASMYYSIDYHKECMLYAGYN